MLESKFTRIVCKQLEDVGCIITVVTGNKFTMNNADRIITSLWGIWHLEFKAENTPLRAPQQHSLELLNSRRSWCAWVIRHDSDLGRSGGHVLTPDQKSTLGEFRNGKELLCRLVTCERTVCQERNDCFTRFPHFVDN
jgi:hypothetical protein